MIVEQKTIKTLGYKEVASMIAGHSLSAEAKEMLVNEQFITDFDMLVKRQSQVAALLKLLNRPDVERPDQFPSLQEMFAELDGTYKSVDGGLLLNAATYIQSSIRLENFLRNEEDTMVLRPLMTDVVTHELVEFSNEVLQIIDESGNVKESHPAIRALVRKVESAKTSRNDFSRKFIKSHTSAMQTENQTIRDGRIVLPVRSDSKVEVEGFVHSASASGNTIFMEPYQLVDFNNNVIMAEQQIQIEIAKIYAELSKKLRALEDDLRILNGKVTKIDCLYSLSSWAKAYNCTQTTLKPYPSPITLLEARHPLLGNKAVPITIKLSSDVRSVVLSGPNAGGKTVTIKTVGLFVLLNQLCGFIPCKEGTSLPLFDGIYTDIGDDQSISDELSTFSGHMQSLSNILRDCNKSSLVILDELGSGTDPLEGGAIASSILDYLSTHAGLSLITSHQASLKNKAYSTHSMMNASMEFNEESHLPTFTVIQGLPGDSHALETAKRMHLPQEVIEGAQRYLGSDALEFGKMIRELESKRAEVTRKTKELDEQKKELSRLKNKLDLHELQVKQTEHYLKESQSTELSRYIRESRSKLENLVSDLVTGQLTKEKKLAVKKLIGEMNDKQKQFDAQIEKEEDEIIKKKDAEKPHFYIGAEVLCGSLKREGLITSPAGKGRWQVSIGSMRIVMKEKDMMMANHQFKKPEKVNVSYSSSAPRPKLVLDLRGCTLEEALSQVRNQIEAAIVHGVTSFQIIHGLGNGVLQTGVTKYLKKDKNVSECHFAKPDDGGMGKTYVELK